LIISSIAAVPADLLRRATPRLKQHRLHSVSGACCAAAAPRCDELARNL
jgi:hypothetical protein